MHAFKTFSTDLNGFKSVNYMNDLSRRLKSQTPAIEYCVLGWIVITCDDGGRPHHDSCNPVHVYPSRVPVSEKEEGHPRTPHALFAAVTVQARSARARSDKSTMVDTCPPTQPRESRHSHVVGC